MSEQRQCVVVGTDGTPGSDAAVRFAVIEARLHQARLILVTAYDRPIDPDVDDFDIPDDQLQQRARDEASESFRRAAGVPVEELPDYEIIAGGGDPAKVLLSSADGAVMIVIGSHDPTMLQRLFGRDVGRELRHRTQVPLAIVPTPGG